MGFEFSWWNGSGIRDKKKFQSVFFEVQYRKYFLVLMFDPWYLWLSNINHALKSKGDYYSFGFVNIIFGKLK